MRLIILDSFSSVHSRNLSRLKVRFNSVWDSELRPMVVTVTKRTIPFDLMTKDLSGDEDVSLNFDKKETKRPFRIDYARPWGVRTLEQWGKITFPHGSKHEGLEFAKVYAEDRAYCRRIQGRNDETSSAWVRNFQNYMTAVEIYKQKARNAKGSKCADEFTKIPLSDSESEMRRA